MKGIFYERFYKAGILILNLVAKGLMNREIAEELSMSNSTTKAHMEAIYRKLNVTNRVQAVVKAITLQIIKV